MFKGRQKTFKIFQKIPTNKFQEIRKMGGLRWSYNAYIKPK